MSQHLQNMSLCTKNKTIAGRAYLPAIFTSLFVIFNMCLFLLISNKLVTIFLKHQ